MVDKNLMLVSLTWVIHKLHRGGKIKKNMKEMAFNDGKLEGNEQENNFKC